MDACACAAGCWKKRCTCTVFTFHIVASAAVAGLYSSPWLTIDANVHERTYRSDSGLASCWYNLALGSTRIFGEGIPIPAVRKADWQGPLSTIRLQISCGKGGRAVAVEPLVMRGTLLGRP
eukprot:365932-Chlamydomonas_euryale.AAC.13